MDKRIKQKLKKYLEKYKDDNLDVEIKTLIAGVSDLAFDFLCFHETYILNNRKILSSQKDLFDYFFAEFYHSITSISILLLEWKVIQAQVIERSFLEKVLNLFLICESKRSFSKRCSLYANYWRQLDSQTIRINSVFKDGRNLSFSKGVLGKHKSYLSIFGDLLSFYWETENFNFRENLHQHIYHYLSLSSHWSPINYGLMKTNNGGLFSWKYDKEIIKDIFTLINSLLIVLKRKIEPIIE